MTSNNTVQPLPNPFTPLAFLPPITAQRLEASNYLFVASLSAYIWDWLLSIPEEIKIYRQRKFGPVVVAYVFSRVGALGYCALTVIFRTVSMAHCNAVLTAMGCFVILAVPSTSALFFFRVMAVYYQNKFISGFFGLLLFALFGLTFLVPISRKSTHIGTTQRCIAVESDRFATVPILLNSIMDTLVFIAISFRIVSYALVGDTFSARMRSFLRGSGLPSVSKSILQGGQIYYLSTFALNIVLVVMVTLPLDSIWHTFFIAPHIALESAMACRVFRSLRLGVILETGGSTAQFSTQRPHLRTLTTSTDRSVHGSGHSHHCPIVVEMSQVVDSTEPKSHAVGKQSHVPVHGYDDGVNQDDNSEVVDV